MKNIEDDLPQDPDQSVILNKDAEFENSSVDPGFVFEPGPDDQGDKDEKTKEPSQQDEQDTQRDGPGLGELDGTNPGSNHHGMES